MNKMHIDNLIIKKLWGEFTVRFHFNPDVNILHGINGSGKTTVLNIINAILNVETDTLRDIRFAKATLLLKGEHGQRTITVEKGSIGSERDSDIYYRIGREKRTQVIDGELPSFDVYSYYKVDRSGRIVPSATPMKVEHREELVEKIGKFIQMRWLSVHRYELRSFRKERGKRRPKLVDAKLEELISQFRDYQLVLEARESQVAREFQHNIAGTMLCEPTLDKIKTAQIKRLDIKSEAERLTRAFREVGFEDSEIKGRIEQHVNKLASSAKKFVDWLENKGEAIELDDFVAVGLINRTRRILDLATELEEKKRKIFWLRTKFIDHCNSFFHDKRLMLDESGKLQCQIIRSDKKKPPKSEIMSLEGLSSGEKQLLILFIEALVQDNSECVYITDEPELSLHVEWQEKLLETIRDLNQNCQIIVATHSPDIVGPYKDKLISMAEVISG